MPSSAGVGLWLPEVGGLVLYFTVLVVWVRPSEGKVLLTQPAALAAAGSLSALASGPGAGIETFVPLVDDGFLSLPPLELISTAATTTIAATSTAPPTICRRRARAVAARAFSSSARRSARRRSFSSWRLATRREVSQRRGARAARARPSRSR